MDEMGEEGVGREVMQEVRTGVRWMAEEAG